MLVPYLSKNEGARVVAEDLESCERFSWGSIHGVVILIQIHRTLYVASRCGVDLLVGWNVAMDLEWLGLLV
jgi:hypothetical protein